MRCKYCKGRCVKKGLRNDKQRYRCKICIRYQLSNYTYVLYNPKSDKDIIQLNAEGMSISGIARVLDYSKQTIIRRILQLANKVKSPHISEYNQIYEVDELWTYVGNKSNAVWLSYSFNRKTHQIMSFCIGARNKINLMKVVAPLKMLSPKKIVTDRLNIYPNLITPINHDTRKYRNNRIERCNLTLRQHIKRLSRKTICYSKSILMLEATFKLYLFWNNWCVKEFGN